EACTLRGLAGGVGFPSLHWFGMVNDHDILAIDRCGPSLEHVFNQLGRQFSSRYLYLLADQLLSRLEFAYSRFIVHGDLNPHSVTLSYFPWQFQQIVPSCPISAARPGYSAHDDLLALGDLIYYFSSGTASWGEFHRDQYNGKFAKKPAIFDGYTDAVFSADPPNYSALRRIFCDAHQYMDCSIPISYSGEALELESETSAILRSSTERLFEVLGSKISEVGRKTGDPSAAWSQNRGISLLQTLPNILQIYTELLFRHCPSHLRECSLFRPYHLPNRLWLDLLWYVGNVRSAPAPFQKAVVGTIYRYIYHPTGSNSF
ncbi:casein kinase family protein, partial [Aspergillus glaucus CBS 516.65]